MEEEKDPSPEYIKAFNAGYTMSKHDPELLSKLLSGDNKHNEYIQAMTAGKQEYLREQMREKFKAQNNDKDKQKER